ncbi:hypothetical protein [Phreatobacter sp.]|uniref:hypothetical protein n=1 Tax=Phreatobacter sp. TaxID=1966341 RepID=UPI0025EA1219|nr:hypothetical protein [Phreatobacter sp.]
MRQISFRSLALSAAIGAIALGGAVLSPSTASAAPPAERSAIGATLGHGQPIEMQRRGGGFRGGGFRGGPRSAGRPGFRPGHGPYRGRGWRGPGPWVGAGAAALIIGGAAAAAASQPYRECWSERRWVDTPWGPEVRRVRVCD